MTRKLVSKKAQKQSISIPWLPIMSLLLLLLSPFFIAKCLKGNNDPFMQGTTNRANKLIPPLALANISIAVPHGKPGLIYVAPTTCEESCLNNIAKMLIIKDKMSRHHSIYLMLITSQDNADLNPIYKMVAKQYPTIGYLTLSPAGLQNFFNNLPVGTQSLNFEVLYLADTKGNLITSYPPTEAGTEILEAVQKVR